MLSNGAIWAMKKNPGWLGYVGDGNPTQLYRDYFINHYKDPVTKQPVQWNVTMVFITVIFYLPKPGEVKSNKKPL